MLSLKSFSLQREKKVILQDLSFDILPGKFTVMLGRNGVGKTTIIRALAGEFSKSDRHVKVNGEIYINGQVMCSLSVLDLSQRRAVLSQSNPFNFPFKTREIVEFGRYPFMKKGQLTDEDQAIIDQALEYADAKSLMNRDVTSLSGGERTRVHFARVLAQIWPSTHDKYLLLDEPTAALDLGYQHYMLEMISQLKIEWQIGVLGILHDLNLSSRYADEILLLREGAIFGKGSVEEVLTEETIKACYEIEVRIIEGFDYPVVIR